MNALQKEIARLKARNALLEQQLATVIRADKPRRRKTSNPPAPVDTKSQVMSSGMH